MHSLDLRPPVPRKQPPHHKNINRQRAAFFGLGALSFLVSQVLLRLPLLSVLQQQAWFTVFSLMQPLVYAAALALSDSLLGGRYRQCGQRRVGGERHRNAPGSHLAPGRAAQLGRRGRPDPTGPYDGTGAVYATVVQAATYENATMQFTVSYYEDGTVCGFYILQR